MPASRIHNQQLSRSCRQAYRVLGGLVLAELCGRLRVLVRVQVRPPQLEALVIFVLGKQARRRLCRGGSSDFLRDIGERGLRLRWGRHR